MQGRRLVLGNADVRISYVVAGATSPLLPQRGRRRVRVRRSRGGRRRDGLRRADLPHRRLRRDPARDDAPLGPRRREGAVSRLYAIEANSHIAPPRRYLSRYGQFLEHAPYCERDLYGPDEPLLVEGDGRRGAREAPAAPGPRRAGRHPDDLRHPPLRRRRLGRLPVPLHVQRRRLRADHRTRAPAAAGAPGLRGPQLRGLQLRAAQGRLPPAGHPGAVLPLERRQRRGHVLRRRRLRGAQGLRHQHRVDLAAPGRLRARTAALGHRGLAGGGVLRRARGHGRHLPAPGPRRRGTGGRGPGVRLDLGGRPESERSERVRSSGRSGTAGRGPDASGDDGGPAVYSNS